MKNSRRGFRVPFRAMTDLLAYSIIKLAVNVQRLGSKKHWQTMYLSSIKLIPNATDDLRHIHVSQLRWFISWTDASSTVVPNAVLQIHLVRDSVLQELYCCMCFSSKKVTRSLCPVKAVSYACSDFSSNKHMFYYRNKHPIKSYDFLVLKYIHSLKYTITST